MSCGPLSLVTSIPAKHGKLALVIGLLSLALAVPGLIGAQLGGIDVYLVYSAQNSRARDLMRANLPTEISVKTYNLDLLAIADYSGKQKAIAKFERARLIILLGDRTIEILERMVVNRNLLIVGSSKSPVSSEKLTFHILRGSDSLDNLETARILEAASEDDLKSGEKIRSSDVILVDEKSLNFYEAVSLVVQALLEH